MERVGDVFLRNFDEGVIVHSLKSYIYDGQYFTHVDSIDPPPFPEDYRTIELRGKPMPDIPVYFISSDTRLVDYVVPSFIVRRDDPQEATERWFSLYHKYRAPAPGAKKVTLNYMGQEIEGYDKYETQIASFPFDMTYQISCLTSGRRAESDAQIMLLKMMKTFRPKICQVKVVDSFGNNRYYNAETNAPMSLKESLDIVDRQSGFTITLKIDGELDLTERVISKAVTEIPIINIETKED